MIMKLVQSLSRAEMVEILAETKKYFQYSPAVPKT